MQPTSPVTSPVDRSAVGTRASTDLADFLQPAFEGLPLAVLLIAPDGAIVLANREAERVFGYSASELIGLSVDALVPDSVRGRHAEHRDAFLHQPMAARLAPGKEFFGRRKDGSEVPVEVSLAPIRVHESVFVVASVVDITERRRHQDELRASQEAQLRFETLIGELGAGFIGVRSEELGRAIEDALGRLVRLLDLDRATLFQLVEETGDFVHRHQWTRPGCVPAPPRVSAQERFPWILSQVRAGELVIFGDVTEIPERTDRDSLRHFGTQSGVTIPFVVDGRVWGGVGFAAVRANRHWTPALINRLRLVAFIFAGALSRQQSDDALRHTMSEIGTLRDRLREENAYLRHELNTFTGAPAIVGNSPAFRRVLEQVRQVAVTDSPVLIVGETGTGKTLIAGRIHELSGRSERALVRVNCASLSGMSIERDLFGHDDGSYRDGESRQVGRLELASRSTVFFDEIADLPLETQATLARVLRDGAISRHAGAPPIPIDVRVIAATRHALSRRVAEGTFRKDLYDRLSVVTIQVPPLRERPDDIPLLLWRFVDELAAAHGKLIDAVDAESLAALQGYAWPGNARELRNVVERAVIVGGGRRLHIPLPDSPAAPITRPKPSRGRKASTIRHSLKRK